MIFEMRFGLRTAVTAGVALTFMGWSAELVAESAERMAGPVLREDYWLAALWQEVEVSEADTTVDSSIPDWDISTFVSYPGGKYRIIDSVVSRKDYDEHGDHDDYLTTRDLIDVEVYARNGLRWYAGVWSRSNTPGDSRFKDDLSFDELAGRLSIEGNHATFHLVDFERYTVETEAGHEEERFAGLWRSGDVERPEVLIRQDNVSKEGAARVLDLEVSDDHYLTLLGSNSSPSLLAEMHISDPGEQRTLEPDRWNAFHAWFHNCIGADRIGADGIATGEPLHCAERDSGKRGVDPGVFYVTEFEYHPRRGYIAIAKSTGLQDWLMLTHSWGLLEQEQQEQQQQREIGADTGCAPAGVCPVPLRLIDLELGVPAVAPNSQVDPQHNAYHGHGSGGGGGGGSIDTEEN